MPTLTFNRVFKAEGQKNGRAWTRWDFKTADDQRFITFDAGLANSVTVNTPGEAEVDGDKLVGWKAVGSPTAEANQQTTPTPQNGSQAVSGAPVASQRDAQIHRQTAAKVAAKLLDFFPAEEQSLETFFTVAEQLVDYFAKGKDEIPF